MSNSLPANHPNKDWDDWAEPTPPQVDKPEVDKPASSRGGVALEKLPAQIIRARRYKAPGYVDVLVDGDYDGEYLSSLRWRINAGGYIVEYHSATDESGRQLAKYLHHFILPEKKGYWRYHINGNKLDNRSCNIGYITPRQSALDRGERERQKRLIKWFQKTTKLREER